MSWGEVGAIAVALGGVLGWLTRHLMPPRNGNDRLRDIEQRVAMATAIKAISHAVELMSTEFREFRIVQARQTDLLASITEALAELREDD